MAESEKAPTTRRGVLRGLAGTLGAALALTAAGIGFAKEIACLCPCQPCNLDCWVCRLRWRAPA